MRSSFFLCYTKVEYYIKSKGYILSTQTLLYYQIFINIRPTKAFTEKRRDKPACSLRSPLRDSLGCTAPLGRNSLRVLLWIPKIVFFLKCKSIILFPPELSINSSNSHFLNSTLEHLTHTLLSINLSTIHSTPSHKYQTSIK